MALIINRSGSLERVTTTQFKGVIGHVMIKALQESTSYSADLPSALSYTDSFCRLHAISTARVAQSRGRGFLLEHLPSQILQRPGSM